MSLNWSTVLGGTGRPRFLICGSELIPNQSFESNLYGWAGSPNSDTIEREQDSDTFWGDYSLKISDVGAQASRSKARASISTASVLTNRSFALSFHVKGAATATCSAAITALDDALAAQTKVISTAYEHFFGIFDFTTSELLSLTIDIFAVAGGSYANSINVDKVSCREILYDLYAEFPYQPNTNKPVYDQSIMSSERLVDGSLKEYNKGWAPNFVIQYDYLDQTAEHYRLLLSEAAFIWYQTHYDYEFWTAVRWDRAFEQRYFGNVYAGHVGKIAFKPIYLLEKKPLDVS